MVRPKKYLAALALCLSALLLAGCAGPQPAEERRTIFAMDTVMNLTLYADGGGELPSVMDSLVDTLHRLDSTLSAVREGSEIYALNHGDGRTVSLSPDTAALLAEALDLCRITGGALDITAYPAVEAWGFPTRDYRVPDGQELALLAEGIDYTRLELDAQGLTARLPRGMKADLGAVAKGYAGDLLAGQLLEAGVSSALLDLGQSSLQAVGTKPDGTPWRIGIQDPMGSDYLGVLEVSDLAVGTSGGYQRYFEQDGQVYWHILDPDTAAPARSGLAGVTVVSPSGLVCDALSTALFVMGQEEGARLWREHPELDFQAVFISQDGSVALTSGLEDSFSLSQGFEDREVTILT